MVESKTDTNNKVHINTAEYLYESPFGIIKIGSDGSAITYVKLLNDNNRIGEKTSDNLTDKTAKQLDEYFSGKRLSFNLPLNPQGTDFQRSVWNALCVVPYGETKSYKQIAEIIMKPKACRAVGAANNKNPIWIIIPCHRVIGSNGALIGYGGGLEMKKYLLDLERKNINI